MQNSNGAAEKELSVSDKTYEMARELAQLSEEVAARVESKLSPISWPEPPVPTLWTVFFSKAT